MVRTYWRYKLAQLCTRCGGEPEDGVSWCAAHRRDASERQRRVRLATAGAHLDVGARL